jgi:hypothetical protein
MGVKKASKAPEGVTTGAASGAILGGGLGLLAGIGALSIPDFGPFIAAGPIMAALAGAGVGGTRKTFQYVDFALPIQYCLRAASPFRCIANLW